MAHEVEIATAAVLALIAESPAGMVILLALAAFMALLAFTTGKFPWVRSKHNMVSGFYSGPVEQPNIDGTAAEWFRIRAHGSKVRGEARIGNRKTKDAVLINFSGTFDKRVRKLRIEYWPADDPFNKARGDATLSISEDGTRLEGLFHGLGLVSHENLDGKITLYKTRFGGPLLSLRSRRRRLQRTSPQLRSQTPSAQSSDVVLPA